MIKKSCRLICGFDSISFFWLWSLVLIFWIKMTAFNYCCTYTCLWWINSEIMCSKFLYFFLTSVNKTKNSENKLFLFGTCFLVFVFWLLLFFFLLLNILLFMIAVWFLLYTCLCIYILLKRVGQCFVATIRYSRYSLMFQCKFRGWVQCYNATNGHLHNSRGREQCFAAKDGHLRNSRDREQCLNTTNGHLRNSRDREQ